MLRKSPTYIVLLLAIMVSSAQAGVRDNIAPTVVLLSDQHVQTVEIDGQEYELGIRTSRSATFRPYTKPFSGTGVLVAKEKRLFLMTARHVAQGLTPDSFATIRADLVTPKRVTLRELSGWQHELQWRYHDTNDLAAIELEPSPEIVPLLQGHFLPFEALSDAVPSRDTTLTVIGFPLALGADRTFSPLSRETKLAGGPLTVKGQGTVLVLQDPSVGGYSGAPVFDTGGISTVDNQIVFRTVGISCVGLMHGTLYDDTGGKFASVVPSSEMRRLLETF